MKSDAHYPARAYDTNKKAVPDDTAKFVGTDLSGPEIERARAEAVAKDLDIAFRVDDMRELLTCELGEFGVVLAFDNRIAAPRQ